MLAAINFRSSFAINRGRPKDCFILQGSIFLASILAIFSFSGQGALIWLAAIVYAIYALLSELCMAHDCGVPLQRGKSLDDCQPQDRLPAHDDYQDPIRPPRHR
jgi:hypothetical protein